MQLLVGFIIILQINIKKFNSNQRVFKYSRKDKLTD